MSRLPHPPWCNHPDNIRWKIQVMMFIIMQFFFYDPSSSILGLNILVNTCSQKPSVYVPPSKWDTKFRTHTAQLAKLQFCIF
jgi:hypothetical protein